MLSFYDCSSKSSTQGSSSICNTPEENSPYTGIQEIIMIQIRIHHFISSSKTELARLQEFELVCHT